MRSPLPSTIHKVLHTGRVLLGGLVLALCGTVSAQTISISNQSMLTFGTLVATPAGGAVTVSPAGQRFISGVYSFGIDSYGPARFAVEISGGNPNYMITLPSSLVLRNARGDAMTVDTFQSIPADQGKTQPPQRIGTLDVGATLRIGPGQPGGTYSGEFPVLVHLK